MERDEVIASVLSECHASDAFLFVGNGLLTRAVSAVGDDERVFYLHGGMGLTVPVAAGFARTSQLPVTALEGDGNALMGMAGALCPRLLEVHRFVHIVMDNGIYETTGGQRTPSVGFDPCAHARNSGYERVETATEEAHLVSCIRDGLRARTTFVRVPVNLAATRPPRPDLEPAQVTDRFMGAVRR